MSTSTLAILRTSAALKPAWACISATATSTPSCRSRTRDQIRGHPAQRAPPAGRLPRPVQHLASHGVTALLAGGMGMRPLMGFQQAGVSVYYAGNYPTVGLAVQAFLEGKLPAFSTEFTCGGGNH